MDDVNDQDLTVEVDEDDLIEAWNDPRVQKVLADAREARERRVAEGRVL